MSEKTTIICDLDGTLCDINHRVHMAQAGMWDEFNSLCGDCLVVEPIAALLHIAHLGGYDIIAVSGRSDNWMNQTTQWLNKNKIDVVALLMRPSDDYRPDFEVKLDLLEQHFGSKEKVIANVLFALDDRDKVVQAMRDYGLTVLQVKEGDY